LAGKATVRKWGEPAGLSPFDLAQGRLWPGQPRRLSLRESADHQRTGGVERE